eukprot:sb/3474077/
MTLTWSQILESGTRFRSLNITMKDTCHIAETGKTVTEHGGDLTRQDFVDAQWKVFLRNESVMWILCDETLQFSINFAVQECEYQFSPYPLVDVDLTTMSGVYDTGESGTDRNNLTINHNSLFRSRDWLSANQGPVFPNPFGS